MSAVFRWTWPMLTPAAIGLELRSRGVTFWISWFFISPSSYLRWRHSKPEPAGLGVCSAADDHRCPPGRPISHDPTVRARTAGFRGISGMLGTVESPSKLTWSPAREPSRMAIDGDLVRLEVLDPERHAASLFTSSHVPGAEDLW